MLQRTRTISDDRAAHDFAANRARGLVELSVHRAAGRTRRRLVHETGSLRVRFPSPESDALSAVLINTAGGVAGGDQFAVRLHAEDNSALLVTTAAAEKIYRSHGPAAQLDVSLRVDAGGRIAWLPQETILFDGASLERRIDLDLAEKASLLCAEIVVFGRTAMKERLRRGRYIDRWRLRLAGRLAFAETIRLEDEIAATLERHAVAAAGVAVATVLVVPGDEALVGRVREAMPEISCEWGLSAWNGFALARFCGMDAAQLRNAVIAMLKIIDPESLPRLWLN